MECSPSEGPCCNRQCKFVAQLQGQMCKLPDDCTEAANCNGVNASCPEPGHKRDNETECNDVTQVCEICN